MTAGPIPLPSDLGIPPNQGGSVLLADLARRTTLWLIREESPAPSSPTAQPSFQPLLPQAAGHGLLAVRVSLHVDVGDPPSVILTSSRARNVQYRLSRDAIDSILSDAGAPTTPCPYCGKPITDADLEGHRVQTHASGDTEDVVCCVGIPLDS
ncbi:uncharacterized protein B0H18DRAFT_1117062 [Fomitopsis serialis]|uniref:uncharacterized protein n=1 Tax=Fomitopsis serialis TaxID=139415 RepID=UPI00200880FE|nr:uncharacterized protein B0H18DRAFT_1117062 [Neoantrodia serialis]KAH9929989.1 hypothetical protein B0H18DRAFT_1117062 [Neoantrodia serialis]